MPGLVASSDDQPRRYIGRVAALKSAASRSKKALGRRSPTGASNCPTIARCGRLDWRRRGVGGDRLRQQYARRSLPGGATATIQCWRNRSRNRPRRPGPPMRSGRCRRGGALRTIRINGRDIQNRHQGPIGAGQAAEQLRSMCRERKCWDQVNRNRPLFDDTGAGCQQPSAASDHTAEPGAPVLEQIGVRHDDDAARVGEQRVPGFANHPVKPGSISRAAEGWSSGPRSSRSSWSGENPRRPHGRRDRRDGRARRTPPRSRDPSLLTSGAGCAPRAPPNGPPRHVVPEDRSRSREPHPAAHCPPIMDRASATVRGERNLALGYHPLVYHALRLRVAFAGATRGRNGKTISAAPGHLRIYRRNFTLRDELDQHTPEPRPAMIRPIFSSGRNLNETLCTPINWE